MSIKCFGWLFIDGIGNFKVGDGVILLLGLKIICIFLLVIEFIKRLEGCKVFCIIWSDFLCIYENVGRIIGMWK